MTIPDRASPKTARIIITQLLPDPATRKIICSELALCWQYAKRNFPEKAFITLAQRYIRMNVGMVEVFVIHPDESVLVVVDKCMVAPNAEQAYKSLSDALPIKIPIAEFSQRISALRPAIFSVVNKLGRTRKHPSAPIGHSPALAELLAVDYPYDPSLDFPDEVATFFHEGACRTITVNAYERNPETRAACLRQYGTYICQICEFDFARAYGTIGREFIHVHHLRPVSTLGQTSGALIHPETDMLPVCPNCHAMLHTRKPDPLTPEELKEQMKRRQATSDS